MANIDELIRQKCAEYDITPDILTHEELEQLKREIEVKQKGGFILDSVLDDPAVFSRGK